VPTPTVVLPGIAPEGGLKLILGNVCVNKGTAVGEVLKSYTGTLFGKNIPVMLVVEIAFTGTTQVADTLFEVTSSSLMLAVA
jgi:hypothetical protein